MPILFRKIRRIKSNKKTANEYSDATRNIDQKQQSKDYFRSDIPSPWFADRDVTYTQTAKYAIDEGKGISKKRKTKTLRKIKSIFQKGKEKVCKECKRVSKICICNLPSVDKTVFVLKDLLKGPSQNVNQSALGEDTHHRATSSPHLRSSSCIALGQITRDDVTALYEINKGAPDMQKYSKYVPVGKMWGPLYPRSFVEDYKMVWLDMQVWYSRYYDLQLKQDTNDDLNSSKSESSLTESPSRNRSFLSDEIDTDETSRYAVNEYREERQRKAMLEQRFRLTANAEYISMVSWQRFYTPLDCRLQLFVSSADDHDLVHLKTEMLVTCLRGFVQADGDFEVLWVADIKKVLPAKTDITTCGYLNPEVALQIAFQLSRVKAVLFVSRAASILLRHNGTGFLDTLAVTAGIDRSALIVLPYRLNPSKMKSISTSGQPEESTRRENSPDPLF